MAQPVSAWPRQICYRESFVSISNPPGTWTPYIWKYPEWTDSLECSTRWPPLPENCTWRTTNASETPAGEGRSVASLQAGCTPTSEGSARRSLWPTDHWCCCKWYHCVSTGALFVSQRSKSIIQLLETRHLPKKDRSRKDWSSKLLKTSFSLKIRFSSETHLSQTSVTSP